MAMVYGYRWTSSYGMADDGTWLAALKNIALEKIQAGMTKLLTRAEDWPPSLPEFIRLCLDIPSTETVIGKMMKQDYSDAVTLAIKQAIGSFNLSQMTTKQLESAVKNHYQTAVESTVKNTVLRIGNGQ